MIWRAGKVLAIVLVAAILVAIIWLERRPSESASVRLTDGREMRVASLTFGREHRFLAGSPWMRVLGGILPTNMFPTLGLKQLRHQTTADVMVVWIETTKMKNAYPPNTWLTVFDQHGLEASPETQPVAVLYQSNATAVAGFKVSSFPRREPTIRIRVKENTGPNVMSTVAEFEVANRWLAKQPAWQAEPLPQTRSDGGMEFTLLGLNTGLFPTGSMKNFYGYETWTEAVFRVGTNEPARLGTNLEPFGEWVFKSLTLNDATGNSIYVREPKPRIMQVVGDQFWMRADDGVANIPGAIWPDETWKLRAEFIPSRGAVLPPEQCWTVNGISLPPAGQSIRLNTNAQLFGASITLTSIDAAKPGDRGPKLRLRFEAPDSRYELRIVRAIDQRGTNVGRSRNLGARLPAWVFDLQPRPGAEMIDVTFGVTRTYSAEFFVKPAVLRTNLAHWPLR